MAYREHRKKTLTPEQRWQILLEQEHHRRRGLLAWGIAPFFIVSSPKKLARLKAPRVLEAARVLADGARDE